MQVLFQTLGSVFKHFHFRCYQHGSQVTTAESLTRPIVRLSYFTTVQTTHYHITLTFVTCKIKLVPTHLNYLDFVEKA